MKNTRTSVKASVQGSDDRINSDKNTQSTVEVLYQKMGDRWFAFSLIDDEVFVGSIAQGEIDCDDTEIQHEAASENLDSSENLEP